MYCGKTPAIATRKSVTRASADARIALIFPMSDGIPLSFYRTRDSRDLHYVATTRFSLRQPQVAIWISALRAELRLRHTAQDGTRRLAAANVRRMRNPLLRVRVSATCNDSSQCARFAGNAFSDCASTRRTAPP